MIKLKGKKVAVVGAGVEGMSSAKWFKEHGAEVTVLDQRDGKGYLENLDKYDLIVRSPGVKRELIENKLSKGSKTEITSQTKLFFDLCPCSIIGVTGTKGKGTTAALIYEMLRKSFDSAQDKYVYLGGNIGSPPLDFLNKLNVHSVVVLELSSFQLLDLEKSPASAKASAGKPHVAVMLMATTEHLDYHKNVYEYVEAKRNLLRFQTSSDFAILNKDYPASRESGIHTQAKIFWVSREQEVEEGCFIRGGKFVVRIKSAEVTHKNFRVPHSQTARHANSENFVGSSRTKDIEIIGIKEILLPGAHNLENICAAVMAARLAGVSKANIARVLKTFKGLEHRLELVREVGGVRYYDDSFSTTPETAIAAIEAFKNPEILILGGSSKNSDFTELGRVISSAKNIKAIIGVGVEWPKIKLKIKNSKLKIIEGRRSMKEIVRTAFEEARPGDVVLLSPACASFDMFKNYKDRGEQFKKEVKAL